MSMTLRVVDEKTRQQRKYPGSLQQKTGIEFDIATVESMRVRNFDFSRELAQDGTLEPGKCKEELLLVISVNDKASFTQFSKSVQRELPEGVLGEMSQRMRPLVNAGQFSEGLSAGVQHFVSSMAEKLTSSGEVLDKPSIVSAATSSATESSSNRATDDTGTAATRPRTVESAGQRSDHRRLRKTFRQSKKRRAGR